MPPTSQQMAVRYTLSRVHLSRYVLFCQSMFMSEVLIQAINYLRDLLIAGVDIANVAQYSVLLRIERLPTLVKQCHHVSLTTVPPE